jgi:hypothetical protein
LAAIEKEQVVALCSFFLRLYRWAGRAQSLWTLSDFRALPRQAGKGITGRGWTAIRQLLGGHPAIISVLDDNQRALRLFSKPRPGWPRLFPVGRLCTNITPLWRWPTPSHPYLVRQLCQNEILDYANSRVQPFSPVIEAADFGTVLPSGQRFWGVFRSDGELLGMAGLSEPRDYRQVKIHGYGGGYLRLYRLGRALGLPLLPEPGSVVPLSTASLLNCPQPAAFRALFDRLKNEARSAGSKFLVWCRGPSVADDPTYLWDRMRFRYHSHLYQLLWDGDQALPAVASPLGYEVAWL